MRRQQQPLLLRSLAYTYACHAPPHVSVFVLLYE
jgi:hypothetical protein